MSEAEIFEQVVKILTPYVKDEGALAKIANETNILEDLKVNSARLVDVVLGRVRGSATVIEVGEIKREISYLGDVLNTAARIQGQCNDYGEELLMSELLKDRINDLPANLDLAEIGEVELRGREEAVKIFAVRRLDEVLNPLQP